MGVKLGKRPLAASGSEVRNVPRVYAGCKDRSGELEERSDKGVSAAVRGDTGGAADRGVAGGGVYGVVGSEGVYGVGGDGGVYGVVGSEGV